MLTTISPGILKIEGYQKDFPECPEYVLDVPQATAVIFSKKVKLHQVSCVTLGVSSQLWLIPVVIHLDVLCFSDC